MHSGLPTWPHPRQAPSHQMAVAGVGTHRFLVRFTVTGIVRKSHPVPKTRRSSRCMLPCKCTGCSFVLSVYEKPVHLSIDKKEPRREFFGAIANDRTFLVLSLVVHHILRHFQRFMQLWVGHVPKLKSFVQRLCWHLHLYIRGDAFFMHHIPMGGKILGNG